MPKLENAPQIGYVGPLAPIIGAVIGAAITAVVSYFFLTKRKSVTFWVANTEDITLPLRRHHKDIAFTVSGRSFFNLNRGSVVVKNTGNATIEDLAFDILIPDNHQEYIAEVVSDNPDLRNSIQITWSDLPASTNPRAHCKISSFLNYKELFQVLIYFDGVTGACQVHCRIKDSRVKLKRGEYVSTREKIRSSIPWGLSLLFVISMETAAFVQENIMRARSEQDNRELVEKLRAAKKEFQKVLEQVQQQTPDLQQKQKEGLSLPDPGPR